jgi:hypothetical protein
LPFVLSFTQSALNPCQPRATLSDSASFNVQPAFTASRSIIFIAVAFNGARLALRRSMKSFQTSSETPSGFAGILLLVVN